MSVYVCRTVKLWVKCYIYWACGSFCVNRGDHHPLVNCSGLKSTETHKWDVNKVSKFKKNPICKASHWIYKVWAAFTFQAQSVNSMTDLKYDMRQVVTGIRLFCNQHIDSWITVFKVNSRQWTLYSNCFFLAHIGLLDTQVYENCKDLRCLGHLWMHPSCLNYTHTEGIHFVKLKVIFDILLKQKAYGKPKPARFNQSRGMFQVNSAEAEIPAVDTKWCRLQHREKIIFPKSFESSCKCICYHTWKDAAAGEEWSVKPRMFKECSKGKRQIVGRWKTTAVELASTSCLLWWRVATC